MDYPVLCVVWDLSRGLDEGRKIGFAYVIKSLTLELFFQFLFPRLHISYAYSFKIFFHEKPRLIPRAIIRLEEVRQVENKTVYEMHGVAPDPSPTI